MKYNIGDKVKIVDRTGSTRNMVGDVGVITEINCVRDYSLYRVTVEGRYDSCNWSSEDDIEFYKEGKMKAKDLKPGDRFTVASYPDAGVLVVTDFKPNFFKNHIEGDSGTYRGLFCEEEVTLVPTEEDVQGSHTRTATGGPSDYYDFPVAETLNDLIENRALNNWGAYGVHLFNVFKACWRWDTKEGTTKLYDAKKIVYSGLRLILMLEGKSEVARYLAELSNDKQFKE